MDDLFNFVDSVVLVTGGGGAGGGASGKYISKFFAESGASVAVVDQNRDAAEQVVSEISDAGGTAIALVRDIRSEEEARSAVESTVGAFGKLDCLVNNAFWHADVQPSVADFEIPEWDRHMDINLRAPFLMTKYALPHLIDAKRSSIVNISSTGAHRGEDGYCAYSAAKAGLESLTRTVAAEYGRDGLRCNCLAPGLVLSEQMDRWAEDNPTIKEVFGMIDNNMLLDFGHGSGKDVAYAVLFLASSGARYITGQTIVMDGGTTSHFPQWSDMRSYLKSIRGV